MPLLFGLCFSIYSIVSLGIYMFYKQGFAINPFSIYTLLGFVLFVINFPLLTINSSNENDCKPILWNKNPTLILFFITLLFATSGIFFKIELLTLLVALIGYGIFIRLCFIVYKKENTLLVVGFAILGSLLSIFITCMLFSIHINPLFYEELYIPDLEDGANWRIDTLYHIASAQIFNTYGIAGQGLDGVKYVPYHYGSHIIYCGLAAVFGLKLIDAYVIFPAILTAPLFLFTFAYLVYEIRRTLNKSTNISVYFIIIFFIGFVGFAKNQFSESDLPKYVNMLMGSPILFLSDSFTVSLIFLNILFIVSINFFRDFKEERINKVNQIYFLFLVFPLIFSCMSYSKISSLIIGFSITTYLSFRLKLFQQKLFTFAYLLLTIYSISLFYLMRDTNYGDGGFSFLYHFKEQNLSVFKFFMLHYAWSWLFLILFFFSQPANTFTKVIRERSSLPVEICLIIISISLGIALFIEIRAGNVNYFSEISSWLSLALILAYLPTFRFDFLTTGIRIKKGIKLILFCYGLYLINVFFFNYKWYINTSLRRNFTSRNQILKTAGSALPTKLKVGDLIRMDKQYWNSLINPLHSIDYDSTRITPRLEFINILNQLGELPREEKEKSCVYIDINNINTLSGRCYEKPFIIPALTGMALIHGGLSKSCAQSQPWFSGYGYEYYNLLDDTPPNQDDIISNAKSHGFRWLYFFNQENKAFTKINLFK